MLSTPLTTQYKIFRNSPRGMQYLWGDKCLTGLRSADVVGPHYIHILSIEVNIKSENERDSALWQSTVYSFEISRSTLLYNASTFKPWLCITSTLCMWMSTLNPLLKRYGDTSQWFIYNFEHMGPVTRCFLCQWVQLQTNESRTLFLMTSLQYHCILGLAEIKTLHPRDKLMCKRCKMRR